MGRKSGFLYGFKDYLTMKKVNFFSGMPVSPDDLKTEQSYFEQRIDTNMGVLSKKGIRVDATLLDGTPLPPPYVTTDTKTLNLYGLIAYDDSGELIQVEPVFYTNETTGITTRVPTLSNLAPEPNSNKLVEGGTGSFGFNKSYLVVIRFKEVISDKDFTPSYKTNIMTPSRVIRSYELFLREDNDSVLSGDVVLAQVSSDTTGLLTVNEAYRDTFGLVNSLLSAGITGVDGSNITFEDHINMGGSGEWSPQNPHRLTAEDLGIDVAATGKHQLNLHSDGIKTTNTKSTSSALYPSYTMSSMTSEETLIIQPLLSENDELVVVNGVSIGPSYLGNIYTINLRNYAAESYEGFYIFAVNYSSKSIVMQGPFADDNSDTFKSALTDRENFPICSFYWGKPFYTLYNLTLTSVDNNSTINLVEPSTYEFLDVDNSTNTEKVYIKTADLVVKGIDPVTQAQVGSRISYNGVTYYVTQKEQQIADADRYNIDPLSFTDRRVFNNTSFNDIRLEDLCTIRDAAPFSNGKADIYYARVVSKNKISYASIGQEGSNSFEATINGSPVRITFIGVTDLSIDQILEQLNDGMNKQIPSGTKALAYINYAGCIAIAASNGIIMGNGSANAKLGFSVEQDLSGDVKTLVYTGDLPSIQEMYYSIDGNIENIYYLTIGNYLRTQKLYYNGDGYITGMDETVEVR